jgi:PST family polysaccharide transporter
MAFQPKPVLAQSTSAKSAIVDSVMALYGVQMGRKLIPLISIPYLARVLGPAGWGRVAFFTALAEFLVILIEFGFNISATREIARHRDSPEICGRVMAGVLGSQVLLALGGVTLVLLAARWIPLFLLNHWLLVSGLFYGVAQGFSPVWFFQGMEKMRLSAALELTGKAIALVCLFVFVHSPADGWKVLALGGFAPALLTLVGLAMAYREIPLRWPTLALIRPAFTMGWPMFVFRSAESLYGVGNAFLLGMFAGPELVGYFSSAEKIAKAAAGLLNPIREAMFPRLSRLAKFGGRDAAAPLAKLGAMITIGGGVALSLALFFGAPLAIRTLLGGPFAEAIAVLRVFSALPVLLSITYSLGFQWLLPFGKDGMINRIILTAGVINVLLSLWLARPFAHIGMAWAVVLSETVVCCSMVLAVWRMFEEWKAVPHPAVEVLQTTEVC